MATDEYRLTRRGTPVLLIGTRLAFLAYFVALFALRIWPTAAVPPDRIPLIWTLYLIIIYLIIEKIYAAFKRRGLELVYAFPLIFSIYILNFVSLLVRGQEEFPDLNRAEHLASFIMVAYIVWVFFLKYLPQKVWQNHPYYTAILVLSVTSLVGAGNEIFELMIDHFFAAQTVGNRYDTSLDLLMNTLGAGLFLSVQLVLQESRKSS